MRWQKATAHARQRLSAASARALSWYFVLDRMRALISGQTPHTNRRPLTRCVSCRATGRSQAQATRAKSEQSWSRPDRVHSGDLLRSTMAITTTAPACSAHRRPLLVFPGGGIFFWWQAGVVRALQECYVMQDFDFAGASAGSLSAVFAACNVDMRDAFDLAFRLAQEHRVWDRPEGLAGIWGNMIRRWLQELLPENAAELCNARVYISVTHIQPSLFEPMKRNQISTFQSKEEVIDACMTSVHIPFFIDGNAVRDFRGDLCVDGSLLFFLQNVPWQTEAHEIEPAWVCNHNEDATLMAKNWSFLQTVSPECFEEMFALGYSARRPATRPCCARHVLAHVHLWARACMHA